MSAWEGKNQILANIPLDKNVLAKRREVQSFMEMREGLDIQLPRANGLRQNQLLGWLATQPLLRPDPDGVLAFVLQRLPLCQLV